VAGDGDRRSVLVVAADDLLAELLAELLQGAGYRVAATGDGAAALQRLIRERPSVVVAEAGLAGPGGGPLADCVREWDVPVVVVGGEGEPPRSGVAILSWPIDVGELIDVIGQGVRGAIR